MNSELNKTLWANADRTRFFVLDDGLKLPPGDCEIRTVTGRQQNVDLTALEPYEISQEEAQTWLVAQLGQVMHQGKDALIGFLDRLRHATPRPPSMAGKATAKAAESQSHADAAQKQSGLSMRLFAALTGESVETLQTDPDAVNRGTRKILADLQEFFATSTSPNEQQRQQARDKIHALRTTLQHQGVNVNESIEKLPETLRQLFSDYGHEQPEQLRQNATKLEELANIIEQSAVKFVKTFRDQASELRRQADRMET